MLPTCDGADGVPGTEGAGDEADPDGAEAVPGTDGAGEEAGTDGAEVAGTDGAGDEGIGTVGTTGTVAFLGGMGADPDGFGKTTVFEVAGTLLELAGAVLDCTGAVPIGYVLDSCGWDTDLDGTEAELDCCWPGVQSN